MQRVACPNPQFNGATSTTKGRAGGGMDNQIKKLKSEPLGNKIVCKVVLIQDFYSMKLLRTLFAMASLLLLVSACNRNLYSTKASRNCGCPSNVR